MYLKKFRRCDKVLDINKKPYRIEEYINGVNTIGFYHQGIGNDIAALFVLKSELYLMYNEEILSVYKGQEINVSCVETNEKEWAMSCFYEGKEPIFVFRYQPYVYYPPDDDSETDVNFGLWVQSILNNPQKQQRFMEANR